MGFKLGFSFFQFKKWRTYLSCPPTFYYGSMWLWLHFILQYSTMALLASTTLCLGSTLLYFTVLHSTMYLLGFILGSTTRTLPCLYYLALYYALHPTTLYHGSNWLYLTLQHSTMALATSLCNTLPPLHLSQSTWVLFSCTWLDYILQWLYYTLLYSTTLYVPWLYLALLDCTIAYHVFTSFYLTLLHSTITLTTFPLSLIMHAMPMWRDKALVSSTSWCVFVSCSWNNIPGWIYIYIEKVLIAISY